MSLTVRQIRFVDIIARDEAISATQAAKSAGYSENTAHQSGSANLKNSEVLEAIQERKKQLAAAAGITPELILHEWLAIATARPADLVSVRKFRCPECWEIEDSTLPPNPACKACRGLGIAFVEVADTQSLPERSRRLYAGAKQTKDGVEIKMRDQDAALRNLADYLGMLNKSKGELSGPGGGAIPISSAVRVEDLTDEQLEAFITASMGVDAGVSELALPAGPTIEGT